VLVALPPLIVVGLAIWVYWLRDDGEAVNVTLREAGMDIALVTRTEALRRVEERVGFRPIVPGPLPVDGLSLVRVDSAVPPDAGFAAPASSLMFAQRETSQPETVVLLQSTVFEDGVPTDARPIDIAVDGAEAWEIGPLPRYLVYAGGMYVAALVLSAPRVTDADVLPMLRSIARQLQQPIASGHRALGGATERGP
jgi:hypothetical protein